MKNEADKPMSQFSQDLYGDEAFDLENDDLDKNSDHEFTLDEAYDAKLKEYNKNLTNLDPMYSEGIKPTRKVIVRVFCNTSFVDESGQVHSAKTMVAIPTKSGFGSYTMLESPFPYSRKAVVVNTPEYTKLKKGDIITLSRTPVTAAPVGSGNDGTLVVPFSFVHPLADNEQIPYDPSNQHFGYLLIPEEEVETIITSDINDDN